MKAVGEAPHLQRGEGGREAAVLVARRARKQMEGTSWGAAVQAVGNRRSHSCEGAGWPGHAMI